RPLAGSATDSGAPRSRWTPAATATTALSVAVALAAGASLTFIGTEGRFPGGSGGGGSADQGGYGVGLNTFTSLRGQLDRDTTIELLRIEGMRERQYLRAFTLSHYDPGEGWRLGPVDEGVDVASGRPLPRPAGSTLLPAESNRIRVEPLNYQDHWLPVFGVPTRVDDVAPGWRYDARSGLIYAEESRRATPYAVEAVVPEYPLEELRTAPPPENVDPVYLQLEGIAPEVSALAERLTAPHEAQIDKANALTSFFRNPTNGFRYSLETETGSGSDALADFLFEGRTGYCEQYSSALAVLLRSIGVPARVAVGFSPGYQTGTSRLVTNNEAHAWVEGYFEGFGWLSFEPTPLNDGRAVEPAHSMPEASDRPDRPEETEAAPTTTAPTDTSTTTSDTAQAGPAEGGAEPGKDAFPVALWVWLAAGVLVS
uniref:transglutaminase family protein n=1 Tax=Actinoalloteichus spitiensis TaxID=252394 RepID=UPI00037642E5